MAKENTKIANIIVVCTSKGGEGKSLLSMQKIPFLFLDKRVTLLSIVFIIEFFNLKIE